MQQAALKLVSAAAVLCSSGAEAHGVALRGQDLPREDLGLKGFQTGLVNPDKVMYKELAYDWPYVINVDRCPTGYLHVSCLADQQDAQQRWYDAEIKKEDQLPMTVDVCYDFCHKVPGTQFFGLQNGDRCFCTPFWESNMARFSNGRHESQAEWTGKGHHNGMCDHPCVGNTNLMCGGKEVADIYQLVNCQVTPTTVTTTNFCGHAPAVKFDLSNAVLKGNNLGAKGPGEGRQEIRYEHVGSTGSTNLDLVVTSTSAYSPGDSEGNGVSGHFGTINIADGTSVDLQFSFVASGTNMPVDLPGFYFSLFDIDQSEDAVKREVYTTTGFDQYSIVPDSDISMTDSEELGTSFKSTSLGKSCDDPQHPTGLEVVSCEGNTVNQLHRAVTLHFSEVSGFALKASVLCDEGCEGFRTMMFAGNSTLVGDCA